MEQVSVEYDSEAVVVNQNAPDGVVPPIPGVVSIYSNSHLQLGPYGQYLIDTNYETDSGIRVVPTSNGEGLAVAVRVHSGVTTKTVHWTVERMNAKPTLPQWATGDPNEVPLTQKIGTANFLPVDGTNGIWRVSGVYTYALLKPKSSSSKYPVGTTPAEVAPSSQRFYGPDDFSDTILDSSFAAEGPALGMVIRVGR